MDSVEAPVVLMEKPTLFKIPYEIQYKILSDALGPTVDFVVKSPVQSKEWRDKYGVGAWGSTKSFGRLLHLLYPRVIPTKVPTALLLVSSGFSHIVQTVAAGMDTISAKIQDEISEDMVIGDSPADTKAQ
ncbi:hypothetical protein TWF730_000262 [Orbilia blumenaviensis]|uniref:Uncharacterized protein n=1 Tax=Orbilia blumenaviensis TaxID=1796055 RepID=A0AAV9VL06_9PEZI